MKIDELKEKLEEKNLDAFLAKENAQYLAETPASKVVIITRGESILLCSRLDLDRAERESRIKDIRPIAKTESSLREGEEVLFGKLGEAISEILKELDVSRIGFDRLKDNTIQEIRENCEVKLQEESDLIWNLRKIKTPEEIEKMKKSGQIASKGMKKARDLIESGRTELEIAAEVEHEMRKLGSQGTAFDTILAGGENSWLPHTEATEKILGEKELIIVDLGARWKQYRSDMTRTFSISPNSKQEKILKVAEEAQNAVLDKVEAGVEAQEIDEAGREVFRKEGYEKFCLHGSGHGVGLDIHEPPSLAPYSEDILEENMVITIEPGIYVREIGGGRFEDMVLVKEGGYEKLTSM